MCRRFSAFVLVLGVGFGGLAAHPVWADGGDWSSPYLASDEPDVKKLLADRTKFIQENYALPAADLSKILQSLNGLVSVQERYQREMGLTMDRLRLVITIVGTDPAKTDDDRQTYMEKFRGQIHRILAKSPMSLQNIVKLTEAALSTEQITPARAKIQAKFAGAVTISGIPFAVENLDALACGPIHPGKRPEIKLPVQEAPAVNPAPAPPSMPPVQNPAAQAPARKPPAIPPQPGPAPAPNVTPQQPIASAPLPPAPPTTQWPELVKNAAEKYDLTAEQRAAVENVLTQSQARAEEHRQRNQQAYDEAAKLGDEDAKMKKLQTLNKPVDAIFDQMNSRIDSIASIEQRNKAAQKDRDKK